LTALVDTSVLAGGGNTLEGIDEPWVLSVITIGELHAGVLLARDDATRGHRLALLADAIERAPVIPIEHHVAASYAQLRAASGRRPSNDLWIAATAVAHELVLLTADERQAALPGVDARLV
jgi:predicted nucleic acid-binding protein